MILGEIKRYIRDIPDLLHAPRSCTTLFFRIKKEGLLDENYEVISKKLEVSVNEVKKAMEYYTSCKNLVYLDKELSTDDKLEGKHRSDITIVDKSIVPFDDYLNVQDMLDLIPSERNKKIALLATQGYNQAQIGNMVSTNPSEHISQVQVLS